MNDPILALNYADCLPDDKDAPILDLGCGEGRMLRFLSEAGFRQILGVDRNSEALASIPPLTGVATECAEADIAYLDQHRGKFRLIIAKQMIYYIGRDQALAYMQALGNALQDDGLLVLEYFNASLLSARLTELKDPFIRTAYTEHAMRRLLQAAGLHERETRAERRITRHWRGHLYDLLRRVWCFLLNGIYILERGYDNELPQIYSKSIISIAGRQPRPSADHNQAQQSRHA